MVGLSVFQTACVAHERDAHNPVFIKATTFRTSYNNEYTCNSGDIPDHSDRIGQMNICSSKDEVRANVYTDERLTT